jgi:signal transduction histidine kinase
MYLEDTMSSQEQVNIADGVALRLLSQVNRIMANSTELHRSLNRVLSFTMDDLGAVSGSIVLLDEGDQPIEAFAVSHNQRYLQATPKVWDLDEYSLVNWVASRGQAALISDTSRDDRWLFQPPNFNGHSQPKSAVSVPIEVCNDLVGVMTFVHPTPGFWKTDHLELLENIAASIGMSILTTRLVSRNQRQARSLAAIVGSVTAAYGSLCLEDVYQQILAQTNQALGASLTSLILYSTHSDEFAIRACSHPAQIHKDGERVPVSKGIAGWVAHQGQAILIPKVIEDPRFYPEVDWIGGLAAPAMLCAPVFSEGRIIGVLQALNSTDIPFEPADLIVLSGIGDLIGNAVSFSRLLQECEAENLRDDLIAMIYHDLRSPLANVVSSLEAMEASPSIGGDPSTSSLLHIALRSADRIQQITSSLLEVNRLGAGQVIGERSPVEVKELLREVVRIMMPYVQEKGLCHEVNIADGLPKILVDAKVIRRVLINLMENAIKYTPAKGKMWVGAEKDGDFVRLWVKDTGPGISMADRERVFEKYTRLCSESQKGPEGQEGMGLGLAFCRMVVQAHGGRIWIESEEGSGSEFSFTMPLAGDLLEKEKETA